MSTFLGIVGGNPLLHMTTDTRTEAQMQGNPGSTTIFHSDLPYIFVREQYTLDSYTNYNGSDAGRTFALTTELQNFKSSNPDLAHLLVLEDSSGNKWVHNPMLNTIGGSRKIFLNAPRYEFCACANGAEYFTAFTTSDSQLDGITRNTFRTSINFIFRPWDVGDTRITVFRTPDFAYKMTTTQYGVLYNSGILPSQAMPNICNASDQFDWGAKDLESDNIDVVKVHFVFLNVEHSATTFDRLPNYQAGSITLNKDDFIVGGIDLNKNQPLVTRGKKASGTTVTPLFGQVLGGKTIGITSETVGKVSTSNVVSQNDTPVLEIPNQWSSASEIEIDFQNKTVKRDGDTTFSASSLAEGLVYIGTKKIVIPQFSESLTENQNFHSTVSSTQTGSFSSPDANTLYLASVVYGGQKLHSAAVWSVGDNVIADFGLAYTERFSSYFAVYAIDTVFYLEIDASGNTTVKKHSKSADFISISSAGFTLSESFEIELMGLKPN